MGSHGTRHIKKGRTTAAAGWVRGEVMTAAAGWVWTYKRASLCVASFSGKTRAPETCQMGKSDTHYAWTQP